ncbi:MAG TPA: hypothetical protein VI159_09470, partial [Gemmatimonadales bacterium]
KKHTVSFHIGESMKNTFLMAAVLTGLVGAGCATTSAQEQRQAEQHQRNSDDAARNGQYGIAGDEQRQAQQSQAKAIQKSLDEGKPVARVPNAPTTGAQAQ